MRVDANRLRNATPFLGTENKKEGKVVTLQKTFYEILPRYGILYHEVGSFTTTIVYKEYGFWLKLL